MRIDALTKDTPASPWERYEDYRRPLSGGQAENGIPAVAAEDTQESGATKSVSGAKECQTCKSRKYQDGSNDPGVSFKSPTHISPNQAAGAVRSHEMEHVTRNQAEAQREDREVVSQSVTYHNSICPECGQVYVSGGTTRTTTRSKAEQPAQKPENTGFHRSV